MRYRNLVDTPMNRRRSRSQVGGKDNASTYDDETHDGLKARHRMTEREVADLKRNWREEETPTGGGGPAVIDMGDSTVYTGYSKPYYPLRATTLDGVRATLSAAGTTSTAANVYRNDTLLGTITIPAGDVLSPVLEPGESFAETDYWQILVTQAGTDASGLTFYGDFA